ncbi:hypothetical protein HDU93_005785 [Gonapodya sp. JEL0774]|nr:hypothetical protein HDU93_005785 [Gonapodya sp. JEL0774]
MLSIAETMMNHQDVDLIAAVEDGDAALVGNLLREGANRNARMNITLAVTIATGEIKTETIQGESALALAILHRHPQVVDALLSFGADPNREITWNIAAVKAIWTLHDWNHLRWLHTITFPSPIDLALGFSGRCRSPWKIYAGSVPEYDNKLTVNRRGGHIVLKNPNRWDDVRVWLSFRVSPATILHLLRHGAAITETLGDYIIPQTLIPYEPYFVERISLIDAVEKGDVDLVRTLLSQGQYDVNVRKKVTVVTRPSREYCFETWECESALALGILYGYDAIVDVLLRHGP